MSKYLVTGGAGFIGSNLVDRLIELGHDVTIYDNLLTGNIENVNVKAKFYKLPVEFVNPEYHKDDGFEAIFHFAADSRIQPSFDNPMLTHTSNVSGTANMLEFAKVCGSKFIFASSSTVHHDMYANPYAFSKQIGENYGILWNRMYKVPVVIARLFNAYGPRQMEIGPHSTVVGIFMRQKRNNLPLTVTGDGKRRRDFIHVADIVEALIEMSKKNYNADVFNVGSGFNYSILEVAEMFKQPIEFIQDRRGEASQTIADIETTMKKLNWLPTHSLEDYVKSELDVINNSSANIRS